MSQNQNNLIKLAIEKAKLNLGYTGDNPSVGCLVVKNNSVISSATTSKNGRPHAEYLALSKKKNFSDASLYVSLEPCSHYGKTPPCTNIIKKKKIKKVVFPFIDNNPLTRKRSFDILKKKKIKVVFNKENNQFSLYESYYNQFLNTIPHIDAKIALSKDLFTINKKNKWITNIYSRSRGHLIRSQYNCIITSYKTINDDNSMFDCRIEGLENKSPDIVILDRNLKLLKNLNIIKKKIPKRKLYIITSCTNKNKMRYFKKKGFKIIFFKSLNKVNDYKLVLMLLKKRGFHRILLESGLGVLNYFLENKFINTLFLFKSKSMLNSKGKNNYSNKIIKSFNLKNKIKVNLLGDELFKLNLKKNV